MVEKISDYILDIDKIGLLIGTDSLELIKYIKSKNIIYEKGMDIGAGTGVLSFSLISNTIKNIVAIEIQKNIFLNLKENILKNNLDNYIIPINSDIEDVNLKDFDIVFSNPPYYKINSGKLPLSKELQIAKFEILLDMDKLFKNVRKILKINGVFFVIYPMERKKDLDKISKKYNFQEISSYTYGTKKLFIIKEYLKK